MQFKSHYSSSKGNLYEIVAEDGGRLLIECGVRWAKLQEALNFQLGGIEGCLLSHAHNDHSHAFKKIMQQGINVYSSRGTWEGLSAYEGEYKHWRRARVLGSLQAGEEDRYDILETLPSFKVLPFAVQHDVPCLGFVIRERATGEYLLFATDFFCLEQHFVYDFSVVAIACSYDADILQRRVDEKTIDETLAKRLLFSHPSKQWVMTYLRDHVDLSKCREIHLLHCSAGNLDRECAKQEIASAVNDEQYPFMDEIVVA